VVLESTPASNRSKILAALQSLSAGGSTAGGAGIELAYKIATENFMDQGNNRVILATDGDFNVGPSSEGELLRMIEKKRETGIFLSVLGFGTGNLQDSKMEQIADKGNGNYSYIDNVLEAKKVLVQEMGGTLYTIAKDVKIQIEFNPATVQGYRLIGYENRMLAAEDFNDDKKDAGELGAGHTVTAIYEIIPAGAESPVELASVDKLKYQLQVPKDGSIQELGQVKLRYKAPEGSVSELITQTVGLEERSMDATSNAYRWSAAIAGWGMLLRKSKHMGTATTADIVSLAKGSKGTDENGYRAEAIRLMEQSEVLFVAEK
ncbi:MAG: YfbK domain-containing protein, partial [Bacteroidota bacterium]